MLPALGRESEFAIKHLPLAGTITKRLVTASRRALVARRGLGVHELGGAAGAATRAR
jgi:hypothetical protein